MAFAIESLSIFVRKLLAFIVYSNKEILLLDNRDSFTYNLVHLLKSLHAVPKILDSLKYIDNEVVKFEKILFSPGPGIPDHFPAMKSILSNYQSNQSILGICLGHQAIAEFYGAKLFKQDVVQHGQVKQVINKATHLNSIISTMPAVFDVGLYHSWAIDEKSLPDSLHVTCVSEDQIIMGIKHKTFNIEGIQFHPESFLTKLGKELLENWLAT